MATPGSGSITNKPGNRGSASPIKRPLIVIAVQKGLNPAQIEKLIQAENMDVVFAQTEQDIQRAIQEPGCFVIFLDLEFEKNGIKIMRRNAPQSQAFWIMVTGPLSTQKRSVLLNSGATDILHHPVSAPQYRLRACNLLVRFLKSFDMPGEVTLPQGYSRRNEVRLEKSVLNAAVTPHPGAPLFTPAQQKSFATTPLHERPLVGIERSIELLAEIRRRLILLPTNRPFDRRIWTNAPIFYDPAFRGMEQTQRDLQELFQKACLTLSARRITLISLQPTAPDVPDCPQTFYALVSSEGIPQNNEPVATLTIPQLQVVFEDQKPFYLDETLPTRIEGQERPATWTLGGAPERMSAIIPILRGEHSALALFIQFDVPCDDLIRLRLGQAVTYLKTAERFYTVVEFFSRIYRGL